MGAAAPKAPLGTVRCGCVRVGEGENPALLSCRQLDTLTHPAMPCACLQAEPSLTKVASMPSTLESEESQTTSSSVSSQCIEDHPRPVCVVVSDVPKIRRVAAGAGAEEVEEEEEEEEGHRPPAPCKALSPSLVHGLPFDRQAWPKVLVQLPMFNEEAHCDLIVQRCCAMAWPRERLLVQVGRRAAQEGGQW